MALKQGEHHYTKWTHVENGKALVRRIHRLEVQTPNGQLFVVKGDKLPDFIQTSTGSGRQGENLAQILLDPKSARKPYYVAPASTPWPSLRDVANFLAGSMLLIVARFVLALWEASF